jgi:hypothetical protein
MGLSTIRHPRRSLVASAGRRDVSITRQPTGEGHHSPAVHLSVEVLLI